MTIYKWASQISTQHSDSITFKGIEWDIACLQLGSKNKHMLAATKIVQCYTRTENSKRRKQENKLQFVDGSTYGKEDGK